jgi:Fe-S cluster assembly protein SufB
MNIVKKGERVIFLTREMVEKISHSKNEPKWMREKRLKSLDLLSVMSMPTFGPDLKDLDLSKIKYFVDPKYTETMNWDEVDSVVREVFDTLGIPEAEKEYLGGVGAQFDSGMVYHKLKTELQSLGVIFENMDIAVHKYEDLVKEYFMTNCVDQKLHYFSALHGAVWSGGTFIYIPKGVKVAMPLQAYFRMNTEYGGQFEHTLIIVDEGAELTYIEGCSAPQSNKSNLHAGCVEIFVNSNAKMKYISIENWSRNTYNLNTKKAIVETNGSMEWVNANMGSRITMLYPCTVLLGDNSINESLGLAFASVGQEQDTGSKVIHLGKNTKSFVKSKSITEGRGKNTFRGYVEVASVACGATSYTACDSILIGDLAKSDTFPMNKVMTSDCNISHEATVSRINDQDTEYLKLYGFDLNGAYRLIVGGFVNEIVGELPLEYAVEFNRLLDIELQSYK